MERDLRATRIVVKCLRHLYRYSHCGVSMTEKRKYAVLFAATLLCARNLMELDSDRPSAAKVAAVET